MASNERCALVLWGAACDEAVAAIFVTRLRAAGLRVWVVGISGRRIAGSHGLRIQPDLLPQQALALTRQVGCVVFPCPESLLARFQNDPTVDVLLRSVAAGQAQFVVPATCTEHLLAYTSALLIYPPIEMLVPFVKVLAETLTSIP
ncbi:MAG: hypothetical protein ACOYNY_03675 [Caldilineaceae bacterium]|jgi:hypothetical protein